MREIESKKEEEKRRRKNQIIVGVIMIFIMLGSTFGIIVNSFNNNSNNNSNVKYNGYTFTNTNDLWATAVGGNIFMFEYNPTQVQKVEANVNPMSSYSGKPLYVFSDDYLSEVEIYRNLQNVTQRIQGACPEDATNCSEDWPTKDCSNNFIIIKESNETASISQNDNCVIIEGNEENLTQITDEFLFKIIGIES